MPEDAITAFARKRNAVAVLRALNDKLNSAEFLVEVDKLDKAEQAKVGKLMFAASLAYVKLKTAALAPLREALQQNTAELDGATKSLAETLADFTNIKPVLDGATAFLKVFARIVALV